MARFKRLTWGDLDSLTRDELLLRMEAEQAYWKRKERRVLGAADREARKQFSDMVIKVFRPSEVADSAAETAAWLTGERSADTGFWAEEPGHGRTTPADSGEDPGRG